MNLLLNVPYHEKDEVKGLGARWNPEMKKWYVPARKDYYKFKKWILGEKEQTYVLCDYFYIISGKAICPKCKHETTVIEFGIEKFFDIFDENIFDSNNSFKYNTGVLCVSSELSGLPHEICTYLKNNYNYYESFSHTQEEVLFANHCTHCNSIQNDFSLSCETDSPFFINSVSKAAKLTLEKINLTYDIQVDLELSYGTEDYLIKEQALMIPEKCLADIQTINASFSNEKILKLIEDSNLSVMDLIEAINFPEIENHFTELKTYETRLLNFQLVPQTVFYKNLRSMLSPSHWKSISKKIRETKRCTICGTNVSNIAELDAHEVWRYDDKNHIQYLDNIISVCKNCHMTIHIGLANTKGNGEKALLWYAKVNKLSPEDAAKDMRKAFCIWIARNQYEWKKDSDILKRITELSGIDVSFPKPVNGKYYLKVPFIQKDKAKKLGAKYDGDTKLWYYTDPDDTDKYSEWLE